MLRKAFDGQGFGEEEIAIVYASSPGTSQTEDLVEVGGAGILEAVDTAVEPGAPEPCPAMFSSKPTARVAAGGAAAPVCLPT